MSKFFYYINFVMLFIIMEAHAQEQASQTFFSARFDCAHIMNENKGANQPCLQISGLRLTHQQQLTPKTKGVIRLNPFGTPAEELDNRFLRGDIPKITDSKLLLIDDYAATWLARPNLEIAIEEYSGAAKIPDTSGLAMGTSFQEQGWDQTALTVTYNLPALEGLKIKLAAGNGEGENGENLDAQQYGGFEIYASVIKGVIINFGMSFDGNNIGSGAYNYYYKEALKGAEPVKLGFSTQRLALGLMLDGQLAAAQGLQLGIGYQKSIFSDLDKDQQSIPNLTDISTDKRPDLSNLLFEDPTALNANVIEKIVTAFNTSYRILDTYFLGFDYQVRHFQSKEVAFFQHCKAIDDNKICDGDGEPKKDLKQMAMSIGGGMQLSENLILVLEYFSSDYDTLYNYYYYLDESGQGTTNFEAYNIRLAYNWR